MNQRRIKRLMIGLGLLFIMPSIAAVTLFYTPGWFHLSQLNRGRLINPPFKLRAINATDSGKWSILVVCEQDCERVLDKVKRVRVALGRGMYRVNQFLVVKQPASKLRVRQLADKSTYDTGVLQLKEPLEAGIYLGDPNAYVMMFYPLAVKPDDIYTDMTRLLQVSDMG